MSENTQIIRQRLFKTENYLGAFDPNRPGGYDALDQCSLFGCVWESINDNNTTAPAVWDGGEQITPNTTDWTQVSGDYEAWLMNKDKPATTGTTGDYPYNGMGRVTLKKNMVNTAGEGEPEVLVNMLTQDMFYKDGPSNTRVPNTNTIFEIPYEFELAEDITIPANCILEFDGGSISDHTITGNSTLIAGNYKFTDVDFTGTFTNKEIEICDTHIIASSKNIVDIINGIIANTNIPKIVFCQSYTDLTKAIRIVKSGFTLEGKYLGSESDGVMIANSSSNVETFNLLSNSSLSCVATIVVGNGDTKIRRTRIRNIHIPTDFEISGTKQYGLVISGTNYLIENCTIQGYDAAIKGYGGYIFKVKNVTAESSNVAFDFSQFPSGVNTTTAVLENCYALGAKIGYSLNGWNYSSLISCACDSVSETAYKFVLCDIDAISIGAEGFSGNFIYSDSSKIKVSNPFITQSYKGSSGISRSSASVDTDKKALIKMANTPSGRIGLLEIDGFVIYNDGVVDTTEPIQCSYKQRNFDVGQNCILRLRNCNFFKNEVYESSVLGSIDNDKPLFGGDVDRYYGVDSYTFAKQESVLHVSKCSPFTSKNIKNVTVDGISRDQAVFNFSSSSSVLQSCENVIIKNVSLNLNNNKLFADNSVQDNVVFDTCYINIDNAVFNSITNSTLTFKDCIVYFDTEYVTPYISATNSDIKFINCQFKKYGGTVYGGKFASGTSTKSSSTRPRDPMTGDCIFDTSLSPNRPVWFNGTAWVDATGTPV